MKKKIMLFLGGFFLSTLAVILPIAYTVKTRSYDDCEFYSFLLGAAVVLIAIGSDWRYYRSGEFLAHDEKVIPKILAIPFAPVGGLLYYSLFVVLHDIFLFLFQISTIHEAAVLTAIFTIALGILLYVFRQRQRILYGMSEAVVGVMVAISHVTNGSIQDHLDNPELYLAVLTAGIYLVVRGLDNIGEGLRNNSNDNFIKKLFGHDSSSNSIDKS